MMRDHPDPNAPPASGQNHLRRIVNDPDFFRQTFDALPLQVVVKSIAPATFGRFLLWNRVFEQSTGLRNEEVVGKTDHDFFPPEQADFFIATDRRVVEGGVRVDIPEEPILSPTLGLRYLHTIKTPIFDDAGQPFALLIVSEDITERKQASDELQATLRRLREERNLFRALLDNLPVCAFAKSVRPEDHGAYVLWNRVMEELHGLSAAEVLGRRTEEIFAENTARLFVRQDERVLEAGEMIEIPLQAIEYGRAGQRLMRTIKAPVFDADGSPLAIVGVAEDITDRIRSDIDRDQANEMLRQINRQIPGALYKLRTDRDGSRRFLHMSDRVEEIFGVPAAHFLADADAVYRSALPVDLPALRDAAAQAVSTLQPFRCEFRILRPDGTLRWVELNSVPQPDESGATWFGFITDVTERKEAEAALQESKQRWELAIAGTEAGVWDWNTRTGEVFYSERWRQMFGYRVEDLPPTPAKLLELVHPDDRHRVRQETVALLRRSSDLFRCEYRMRCADGQWMWILAHAKAHFDADGKATRMIGTLIDITARKQVEAELLEAKHAAENASRAKSDFLAMMSHEIRTPLNGVLGFAELLNETTLDARQREFLQTIRESGANLLHVLNDILDYSKIESGKLAIERQPAATREIVAGSVETFRAKAGLKNLQLTWEVAPEVPAVISVDALRLRQVLTNLISNAVKFTSRGGIVVRVTCVPGDAGRHRLEIRVEDTGIGIPPEDLPRLFQPFEQFDVSMARRFGGTGLGLSIVQRLLALMGGSVSAASRPGVGTTFTVVLPVETAELSAPPAAAPVERTTPTALSILLVEDNAVNRRLAALLLQRLGYAADEAHDGAMAVDLAAAKGYDLVLMDIQMPGMDGYETARRIWDHQPGCTMVALTANALVSDRERSLANGFQAHLTKPLRAEELRAVLARHLPRPSPTCEPG